MGKHFLWDPVEDNIIEEFDDAGNTIADYTTEPYLYGDLVSQHRDGQPSFYHYDGQGNTTSLTDSIANVTDTYAYSAFGELTAVSGSTVNPFQYIGQKGYYKEATTGEYDVRRRPLLGTNGRWLSLDPLMFRVDVNHFRYAYNAPIIFTDPSGMKVVKCLCICHHLGGRGTHWRFDRTVYIQSNDAVADCKSACFTGDIFNECRGTVGNVTVDQSTLIGFCTSMSACPKCNIGACENVITRVLNGIQYSNENTTLLDATPLSWVIPGRTGGYCHQWANNFGEYVNFGAWDSTSCLHVKMEYLDLSWVNSGYNDHRLHVIKNQCTGKCLIVQNWPYRQITDPCTEGYTWASFEPDGVFVWNDILSRCGCGKTLTPPPAAAPGNNGLGSFDAPWML